MDTGENRNSIANGAITSGEEIDAIFVCAVAPEILLPAVACEVQKEIGAVHAFAYDMNAACSGFVFAYNQAVAYMNMGMLEGGKRMVMAGFGAGLSWGAGYIIS